MLKIYHYPRCKYSRNGKQFLIDKNIAFTERNHITNPLTEKEIKILLNKLNLNAIDIIRTNDSIYLKQFKNKQFTNEEWISILIEFPKLIKRPIIESDYKAIIGNPVENIYKII